MNDTNIDIQINAVLTKAAADIKSIVSRGAKQAVDAALGASAPSISTPVVSKAPASTSARKPAAKKTAKPAKAPAAAAKPAKTAARAPGEKRSPQEIAKLRERISNHIKKHPKQRVEEISKALGTPTKEMNLVLVQLKRTGAVTTEGQKRAMTYTWNPAALNGAPAAG